MKIDRLETHDRLLEFQKQSDYISQGCYDCIMSRPEEYKNYPFYIFAHKRERGMDERIALFNQDLSNAFRDINYVRKFQILQDVPTARILWEPRLTKPEPQINSMLFMAYPPSDKIKIIWIIPEREMWPQYDAGKITELDIVPYSVELFVNNPKKLQEKDEDELPDNKILSIMCEIGLNARNRRKEA